MPGKSTSTADCPPHLGGGGWDASQSLCPGSSLPLRVKSLLLTHSPAASSAALSGETNKGLAVSTWMTFAGDSRALDSRRKAGKQPPTCTLLPPWLPWAPGAGWKWQHFFFDILKLSKRTPNSRAVGRSREGHRIFICHKLCLGEH